LTNDDHDDNNHPSTAAPSSTKESRELRSSNTVASNSVSLKITFVISGQIATMLSLSVFRIFFGFLMASSNVTLRADAFQLPARVPCTRPRSIQSQPGQGSETRHGSHQFTSLRASPIPRRLHSFQNNWEGDDIRWSTRMRRRIRRSVTGGSESGKCRNILIAVNVLMFLYQTVSTVNAIRLRFPSHWPHQAVPIALDALWGSSVPGPLEMDFAHSSRLSRRQPHRFLTSGFLHGGILHMVLNMDALRRLPNWLETGLGAPMYLTTYLVSIIAGNLGHSISLSSSGDKSLCLGSSGGICGLYGLMYVSLVKMGNDQAATRVMRGMAFLFLYGVLIPDVSNAAHVGGFIGGILMALLFGPSYEKSYSLRKKWSLDVDVSPRDYRLAMGFGTKPTSTGLVPLPLLWLAVLVALVSLPQFRTMPGLVLRGLVRPGSVYGLI